LDDLLGNGIIKLLIVKQLEELGRTTNPKSIMLKEYIMQLAKDGMIILNSDDSVGTNHISARVEYSLPSWQQNPTQSYQQGKTNVISSQRVDLFTIHLEAQSPVGVPLMV